MRALAVVLLAAAAVTGVSTLRSGPPEAGAPRYRLAQVERGPFISGVTTWGTVNAVTLVEVGTQVSGLVRDVYADFNSPVRRGDIIARIDPASFEFKVMQARAELEVTEAVAAMNRAQLAKARADVSEAWSGLAGARAELDGAEVARRDAQRSWDRKRQLGNGIVSQSDLDQASDALKIAETHVAQAKAGEGAKLSALRAAEASLQLAQAQLGNGQAQIRQRQALLRQAEIDLAHTFIRAPVDGVVVNRNVNRGQTVAASLQAPTLFTIGEDLSRMQVEALVSEADIGVVRVGQQATFSVDSFPGQEFSGAVTQIRKVPKIDQNVVAYVVIILVDNSEQKLLPGMTADLRIIVASKEDALTVPNGALRFSPGAQPADGEWQERVFRLADGRPEAVPVVLGANDGQETEILDGELGEGDSVILGMDRLQAPAETSGLANVLGALSWR